MKGNLVHETGLRNFSQYQLRPLLPRGIARTAVTRHLRLPSRHEAATTLHDAPATAGASRHNHWESMPRGHVRDNHERHCQAGRVRTGRPHSQVMRRGAALVLPAAWSRPRPC